jgi:peptidyl-prolyl cis-trans isomerase SurA
MRNASIYQMKILAVLLCTAALGGCSIFSSKKPAPAPAAAAPAAAAPAAALNTTPAAPAKPSGAGFLPPGETGNVIDSIVVVVNDEVITQRELAAASRSVTDRMKAQNVADAGSGRPAPPGARSA